MEGESVLDLGSEEQTSDPPLQMGPVRSAIGADNSVDVGTVRPTIEIN